MAKKSDPRRKPADITLEEAIEVVKLSGGYFEDTEYKLRRKKDSGGKKFAQLFYNYGGVEKIVANFSDDKDMIDLHTGNKYYRTFYRIIKYMEKQGFDLESIDSE